MRIRQPHGLVERGGRNLDDDVATGEMRTEAAEDRRCLGRGERPAFAAAGDGGGDLDGGDAGGKSPSAIGISRSLRQYLSLMWSRATVK
jgi:hypothetical protein